MPELQSPPDRSDRLVPRRPLPPPTQRIGDAERSRTCELLQSHFAVGRLDADELDERLGAAMAAKTHGDLRGILTDLPSIAPHPPVPAPHPGPPSTGREVGYALGLMSVLGAVGIVAFMLLGSMFLGGGVFFFSLIGGGLALYVGAGSVWLAQRLKTSPPPRPPAPPLR